MEEDSKEVLSLLESTRAQGGLICAASLLVALIFIAGLLSGSWWAVAIPVALLLSFVIGLVFWVGWTIMTVDVQTEDVEASREVDKQSEDTLDPKE